MTTTSFNLCDEPWIRVRDETGVREVTLRGALVDAHRITALAGEVPTQDVAILRLLLAVLYRVVDDEDGYPEDVWRDLWEAPTLPAQRIAAYLDNWRHRFDLLDASAPFFQVAGLTASRTSGLHKLIADVPDGYPYFTTRAGAELESLSLGEAARWLVHAQAYDPSGIKTGAVGDPRTKGGKGYPIGTGWAGKCGLVLLEGDTLKDTLLLNLVLGMRESDDDPDLPVWERPPLGPAKERGHTEPLGPADLYTWPARRVLLHVERGRVVDVQLSNGDRLDPQNRQAVEPMSAWRRSANQEKKLGGTVYMPRTHDPARALWRGLAGLLVQEPEGGAVRDVVESLAPRTLTWLAELEREGAVDADMRVRLRGVGITYGTQSASVESVFDDALVLSVAAATIPEVRAAALVAAEIGEKAALECGWLGANLAVAAGRMPDGPRDKERAWAFHAVGLEYGRWLSGLDATTDLEAALARWRAEVDAVVAPRGESLVHAAGEVAVIGRRGPRGWMDAAVAYRLFRRALTKTLHPEQTIERKEHTP